MSKENKDLINRSTEEDVMFFSRPFALPGKAFGSLNMFFHQSTIQPKDMEALGRQIANLIDQYFMAIEGVDDEHREVH